MIPQVISSRDQVGYDTDLLSVLKEQDELGKAEFALSICKKDKIININALMK
jgi:hypothetical protein